jgi:hypothetical protein
MFEVLLTYFSCVNIITRPSNLIQRSAFFVSVCVA